MDAPTTPAVTLQLPELSDLQDGAALAWALWVVPVDEDAPVAFLRSPSRIVMAGKRPPTGTLVSPADDAVVGESADQFMLRWEALAGNCEDLFNLSYTVFFAPLNGAEAPANLFGSSVRFEVPEPAFDMVPVIVPYDLSGKVAWGVQVTDGTDTSALLDAETGFTYRIINVAGCGTDADCSDGNLCNGQEACVNRACRSGTPPVCLDDLYCNGEESCDPGVGCIAGTNPCRADFLCDEVADVCVERLLVAADQCTGDDCTPDGLAWPTAFPDLQTALDLAASVAPPVPEIWAAGGIYVPTKLTDSLDARTATFQLLDGVAIYGGFCGDESTLALRCGTSQSTLSGDLLGDDEEPGQVIGSIAGTPSWQFDNAYHVLTADGVSASAVLDGFTVSSGFADVPDGPDSAGAGLLVTNGGGPSLRGCDFTDNQAEEGGAAIAVIGGATMSVAQCRFVSNFTFGVGGALITVGASDITIVNSLFRRNRALEGGAIYSDFGTMGLINTTFTQNTAGDGEGGAIYNGTSSISIVNSILWGDSPAELGGDTAAISVSYSDVDVVEGTWPGTGNLNLDPLFTDSTAETLCADSPCIDAGNDGAVPSGENDRSKRGAAPCRP